MYDIKVLNDKDFFEVAASDPKYSYVDEDNLGFADPVKGKAYVRYVAHPELQKYLIYHEFEELASYSSTHEDPNGIRHKKFFKQGIAPFVSSLFGGKPKEELPQTPIFGGDFVGGQYGGPLGQFSVSGPASARIPEQAIGGHLAGPGFGQGLQGPGQQLPPDLLERTKGFLEGRVGRLQFPF